MGWVPTNKIWPPRGAGLWYGRDLDRIIFEGPARQYPGLRPSTVAGRGRIYRVTINVLHYERRHVEIRFDKASPRTPRIYADGPLSPHRYEDNRLCIWHPEDLIENSWVFGDGLIQLLEHVQ